MSVAAEKVVQFKICCVQSQQHQPIISTQPKLRQFIYSTFAEDTITSDKALIMKWQRQILQSEWQQHVHKEFLPRPTVCVCPISSDVTHIASAQSSLLPRQLGAWSTIQLLVTRAHHGDEIPERDVTYHLTCLLIYHGTTTRTFRVSLLSTFRVFRINYSLVCSLPIHTWSSANVDGPPAHCQFNSCKMLHKCSTDCIFKKPASGEWPWKSFKVTTVAAIW